MEKKKNMSSSLSNHFFKKLRQLRIYCYLINISSREEVIQYFEHLRNLVPPVPLHIREGNCLDSYNFAKSRQYNIAKELPIALSEFLLASTNCLISSHSY